MLQDEVIQTAVKNIDQYYEHEEVHCFYGEFEDGTGCVNVRFDYPRDSFFIQITHYEADATYATRDALEVGARAHYPYLSAEVLLPAFKAVVEMKGAATTTTNPPSHLDYEEVDDRPVSRSQWQGLG